MGTITPQITSLTIVYSTFYSDVDQRKHQSSASLAFVRGIHRGPVNSPHKWPATRKKFPFDGVIMKSLFDNDPLLQTETDSICHDITGCLWLRFFVSTNGCITIDVAWVYGVQELSAWHQTLHRPHLPVCIWPWISALTISTTSRLTSNTDRALIYYRIY